MLTVLTAFRCAAQQSSPTDAEPHLNAARAAWPSLTADEQHVLLAVGQLLAADGRSAPMAAALTVFEQAAGETDPSQAREVLNTVREHWTQLTPAQRDVLTPVGKHIAAQLSEPSSADDVDEDTAAMLAYYSNFSEHDFGSVDDDAAAGEDYDYREVVADLAPRQRRVGIRTDLTPEQLLERMRLTEFRPDQRDAVQAALEGRDSLIVMPTGGGKSLCYQLPAIASDGLTVVVSPLIALIADQHRRLLDAGHPSAMLAGVQGEDANRLALDQVRSGEAQIVFCAPERFSSKAFLSALARRDIALFVVDEAHCVSEWGHDFRPDYLRLRPVIEALGRPPIMAATATATPKVASEIEARLGLREPLIVRRGFDRPNLSFDVISESGDGAVARKRAALLGGLKDPANRPAVVYCGTRKDTETTCELLNVNGVTAAVYHAGMSAEARACNQQRFMTGAIDVVCATNAFGMGVDKADIRSVWHWALPTSVEAYYQEAGRAGRDGKPARAVLLAMRGDLSRLIHFIKNSELTVEDVKRTLAKLRGIADDGVALIDPREQDDKDRVAVAVAERAGAVSEAPAGGGKLAVTFIAELDEAQAARLCKQAHNRRWDAYQALKKFADTHDVCRRRQLLDHFGDDEPGSPQGRCCDVCDPIDWLTPDTVSGSGRSRRRQAAARTGARPDIDAAALERLKVWRLERADGKPAYTVATNAALEELLIHKPRSRDQLLNIKGIGPSFVAKHADDLLPLLAEL